MDPLLKGIFTEEEFDIVSSRYRYRLNSTEVTVIIKYHIILLLHIEY